MTGFNCIGWAVKQLQDGKRVRRAGWNGKGMWLFFTNNWSSTVQGNAPPDYHYKPWIGMKTADDGFVPWLCSQADLLAIDWEIVEAAPCLPPRNRTGPGTTRDRCGNP